MLAFIVIIMGLALTVILADLPAMTGIVYCWYHSAIGFPHVAHGSQCHE